MDTDSSDDNSSFSDVNEKKRKHKKYDNYYEKKKKGKERKERKGNKEKKENSISSSSESPIFKKKKINKYYSSSSESKEVSRKKRKNKKEKRKKSKKYHNESSDSENSSCSENVRKKKKKKEKRKKKKEETITVKELKKERENLMKIHFNYTDECNPFGDNTLSTPFVWKLKNKYEKIKNDYKVKLTTNILLENSISKISEIEEVKKRREEREKERSLLEDYRLQLEKQRNQINIKEYREKEQIFFINQEIKSSDHRISHNIMQPVDLFRIAIKIINFEQVQNFDYSYLNVPFYNILGELKERELKNCEKQVKLHILHDKMYNEEKYKKYWKSLLYFVEFYLDNSNNDLKNVNNMDMDEKMNAKIKLFFENKNYDELTAFEEKIKKKIVSDDSNFDVNYWNTILLKIPYFKSKYILDDFHKKLCAVISINNDNNTCLSHKIIQHNDKQDVIKKEEEKTTKNTFECKSPSLFSIEKFEDDDLYFNNSEEELEERKKINEEILRKLIKDNNDDKKTRNADEENILNKFYKKDKEIYDNFVRREKKKGIKDEIIMKDVSINLLTNTLKCSLFVTRKPLYFNRIKTSFDWNKYNKTHYDYENTPPKYICGYKFNIFYTNLLNKKQPPTWKLEHTDDENKVLIIFHGGAPYLDIAFKIVNAEWSFDKNRGFRNVFDKGILQLYFNFKKKRYRR